MAYFLMQKGEFSNQYVRKIFALCDLHKKADMRLAFLLEPSGPARPRDTDDQGQPYGSSELSHVAFKLGNRAFMAIDSPGHDKFIHQAIIGLSQANVGILVLDPSAANSIGESNFGSTYRVQPRSQAEVFQSHIMTAKFFGIPELIVAISKMDLGEDGEARFKEAAEAITDALKRIDESVESIVETPSRLTFLPTGVRVSDDPPTGLNVVDTDERLQWWSQPNEPTLEQALAATSLTRPSEGPLRFSAEQVLTLVDGTEIVVAGKVLSGSIKVGDTVKLLPTEETARVASLSMRDERKPLQRVGRWAPMAHGSAGQLIGVALRAEGLSRTAFREVSSTAKPRLLLTLPDSAPPAVVRARARIFVTTNHLAHGSSSFRLTAYVGGKYVAAEVDTIYERNNETVQGGFAALASGDIADVSVRFIRSLNLDTISTCPDNARLVLLMGHVIVAGGFITEHEE